MKHEDRALQAILQGRVPEKRIMVQVGLHEKKEPTPEEIQNKEDRNKALQSARMPWFCPKCEAVMNGQFDRKFFYMRGTCFDCVLKEETEMKINGTYDLYEKIHMWKNSLSVLRDAKVSFEEMVKSLSNPSFVNENGGIEEWEGVDLDKERENMLQIIEDLTTSMEEIRSTLTEAEDEFKKRRSDGA